MRFSKTTISVLAFVCGGFVAIAGQPPTTWYVDDDGDETNGCTSWADACPELQTALVLANSGDQIWVAEGTYTPAGPGGDRLATFQLCDGVALMGGYAGFGAPDPDARDIELYETILSGDLNGDDDTDGDNSENSYHVTTGSGTGASAGLDGFTITAGNANDVSPNNRRGGGMINDGDAGTAMTRWDGDRASLDWVGHDVTSLPYHLYKDKDVAIIGVGGGRDVLTALWAGSGSVTGIEINDVFIELLEGSLSDFANLADRPNVELVQDEARSYLTRMVAIHSVGRQSRA